MVVLSRKHLTSVSVVWRSSFCAVMGCFSYMNAFIYVLCTMLLCSCFKFVRGYWKPFNALLA